MSTDSPLIERAGAVRSDAGIAHFGDPFGEQRRLAAGAAFVELADRRVLRVSGPDRLSWLDSLTSQRLIGLAAGESAETLLLDPQGRIERQAAVLDDGEATWLIVDEVDAGPLAAFLERMRFLLRVEVDDVSAETAVLAAFDGPVLALLPEARPFGGDAPLVWHDPWRTGAAGGVTRARGAHPASEFALQLRIVPRAALTPLARGTVPVAGLDALEALRIAAWRPRRSREADARTLPHELDWLRSAVHLDKGCYRGQETVAKVHNLGGPPRRLVQLDLDGSLNRAAAAGDAVLLDDAEVGRITSVAMHYEAGPVALALVRRKTPETESLIVAADGGPVAAAQRVIVPAEAAPAVQVPRLPRLGSAR